MTETIDNHLTARFKQLRTKRHLQAAPDMVAHILTLVTSTGGGGGDRVSGGSDLQRLPLNAQALEDANSLYAQLVNWAISHARSLHVRAPSVALGWSRRDQDCDGFPSWATIEDAAALTNDITDWLIVGADRIARLVHVDAYYDDIRDMMAPLYGRYPVAPPRPRFASRECLVCGRRAVIVDFDARFPLGYDDGLGYDEVRVSVACTYCGHPVPASAHESYLEEKS